VHKQRTTPGLWAPGGAALGGAVGVALPLDAATGISALALALPWVAGVWGAFYVGLVRGSPTRRGLVLCCYLAGFTCAAMVRVLGAEDAKDHRTAYQEPRQEHVPADRARAVQDRVSARWAGLDAQYASSLKRVEWDRILDASHLIGQAGWHEVSRRVAGAQAAAADRIEGIHDLLGELETVVNAPSVEDSGLQDRLQVVLETSLPSWRASVGELAHGHSLLIGEVERALVLLRTSQGRWRVEDGTLVFDTPEFAVRYLDHAQRIEELDRSVSADAALLLSRILRIIQLAEPRSTFIEPASLP
jgi:hypothetical protein